MNRARIKQRTRPPPWTHLDDSCAGLSPAHEDSRAGRLQHRRLGAVGQHFGDTFQHTFDTRMVMLDMPTDAVQVILGYAFLQTTSVYLRAERRRTLKAASRCYA